MKKVECPYCETKYDYFAKKCPQCGEPNTENKVLKKYPNMVFQTFWKQLVLFAIGYLGFNIIGTLVALIVKAIDASIFGPNTEGLMEPIIRQLAITNTVAYLLVFAGQLFVLWKDLKGSFVSFKNYKAVLFGLIGFAAIMSFSALYNTIIDLISRVVDFPTGDNANQQSVVLLVENYPISSIIIVGLVGPMVEELTYRVGLFGSLRRKNRALAYVVTILVFALIHTDFTKFGNVDTLIVELINIPSYLFAAATLTVLYEYFGLAGSYYAHITNNLVSVVGILLTKFLA